MPKYKTNWLDYRLPSGQDYAVAVCGYSGRIRHMTFGNDEVRRMFVVSETIEKECNVAKHCLALDCPLNRTEREHILHMLDMHEDETLDAETSRQWGTESALEGLLKFVEKMNAAIPEELKKPTLLL